MVEPSDSAIPMYRDDSGSSIRELLSDLPSAITEHGFFHVRCPSVDDVEPLLLTAQDTLGTILHHDRSLPNGLVPIQYKPHIPKKERLISDNAGDAAAHTDGAFMRSPPRVIALGVRKLSSAAPQTYTIDAGAVLDGLPDDVILRHARQGAARLQRADRSESFTPLEFRSGRVSLRYRFDDGVHVETEDGGPPLFERINKEVLSAERKHHGLAPGSVIFMDNMRLFHGRGSFDPDHTDRDLLRAWYPGDSLTVGTPWRGRSSDGTVSPGENEAAFYGRSIRIHADSVVVNADPSRDQSTSDDSDPLVFAIKQAIGFRHSPARWHVRHDHDSVELRADGIADPDGLSFGRLLLDDLSQLLS